MNPGLLLSLAAVCVASLLLAACDVGAPLGATVGGAQDIGYARQIIESGGVPAPEYIMPEGVYSEHDIPTPTGDCADRLCLALGYGYAPAVDDGREALFVHLGMTSTIEQGEFHRNHLQLAVVVDKSGSMEGGSMSAVKDALGRLLDRLDADDELVLVEFNNSARTLFGPARVTDRGTIRRAIDRLEADGGTNIEAGISLGYEALARLAGRPGTDKRLMLFTDAMPNVGATDGGSFRGITKRYADEGIGLTSFGVGVDFGQELIYHISRLRGGNFFFLENADKIRTVFDKEFDLLVTPLVYNLKVAVTTPPGLRLKAVYGLPDWTPDSRDAELTIPTVFLSSNRGAIILRYEREDREIPTFKLGDRLVSGTIDYVVPDEGERSAGVDLHHTGQAALSSGVRLYSHEGTRLAVVLTNFYLGLHEACDLVARDMRPDALDLLERTRAEMATENAVLNDQGLEREIRLVEKLAENIRAGS